MSFLYRLAFIFAQIHYRLFYRVKIHGKKKSLPEGKYILCANHISAHDIFLAAMGINRQVFYLAKSEATEIPLIGGLIRKMTIPIHRGASDISAIKSAISAVNEGKLLGVFPQGTRIPGKDPAETKIKSGIGLIAYHAKATVLPVFIGAKEMKIRPFRKTEVRFGKPIAFDELGFENGGIDEYRHASEIIFEKICELGKDISSSAEEKQ